MPHWTAAALDSISEGFIILDHDWRFVFVNPAAERFMQKSGAEVLGQSLWEAFPDAAVRRFGIEYRRAVAENAPVEFEEFYPDPLNAWFEVRAFPSPEGLSIFFRDITARRGAEEALRERVKELRCLYSIADLISDDGHVEEILQGTAELMPGGWSHSGVACARIILNGQEFKSPEFRQTPWSQASEIVVSGEPAGLVELCYLDERPARDEGPFLREERELIDEIARRLGRVVERKRLEESLRVNLTKYSVLFDSFPLGISVTSSAGDVLEINPAARNLLGVSDEQVVGQRVGDPRWPIVRPDGSPMPPEEFASVRAIKNQAVVEDVETGIARPGEDVIWLSVSAAPLPLEGYGVVITYGDISRRKQIEARYAEAHREAEAARARLEAVMDALPTGLAIVDAQGGVRRSNAAYERIWGEGRPNARTVADYRPYRARWVDAGQDLLPEDWASARAIRDGEPVVGQTLEIDRFDGGRAYVLNSAAPIFDDDGSVAGCVVAILDISRRIEAERALAASQAALAEANRELQESNEALRRSNETLEARVAERTADLARRTAQLRALALDLTRAEERERRRVAQVIHDHLQQLLSVARINLDMVLERVRTKFVRKALEDAGELLAESLDITRSLTAELSPAILHRSGLAAALRWLGRWYQERYGLEVAVEAVEDVELDGETRVTLFRAVRELLFNVVKHARVNKARVQLSRTADGRAEIVVSDQGVGFDPELLRAWDGTDEGFGLFSLRERLDLLGGQFEVVSAPGRGTSFTISGAPPGPAEPGMPPSPPDAPLKHAVRRRTGIRSARRPRATKR